MPDTPYMPIPAHIYAIACALVTTKHEDESPVVIRVEDIPSLNDTLYPVPTDAPYTVYPVTFVARYTAHDKRHRLTGERCPVFTFTGWDCQHAVVDSAVEQAQIVGDVDNA